MTLILNHRQRLREIRTGFNLSYRPQCDSVQVNIKVRERNYQEISKQIMKCKLFIYKREKKRCSMGDEIL